MQDQTIYVFDFPHVKECSQVIAEEIPLSSASPIGHTGIAQTLSVHMMLII